MTTREVLEKMPKIVRWKIDDLRKDYKNEALNKYEVRAQIYGYTNGLRDAGLINESERKTLFVYATI